MRVAGRVVVVVVGRAIKPLLEQKETKAADGEEGGREADHKSVRRVCQEIIRA